jgi:spermidine synthase
MGVTKYIEVIIYAFSILIGLMIGMEIPLVTRLNGRYENLKFNIANVMEKDYYGSLLGGVFFAFVGLPYLGLTYTPFVLGAVNLVVAIALLFRFNKVIAPRFKKYLNLSALGVVVFMILGVYFANPIIQFGEQSRYEHKVVFSKQTKFQKITMTQWKNNHVLYLNNSMQLNTMDEWLYHEPLVHPVMLLQGHPVNVLILGGGDGCGIREVLKYPSVKSIKIVDLDPDMTDFGANNPVFKSLNEYAYHSDLVEVINQDAFIYLENDTNFYDVIIIDFPDPRSIELGRLYTKELYHFCYNKLSRNGLIVTQATSPYFQTKAFRCIEKTIASVGFNTLPIHNHVQSFGEWGWIIGSKYLNSEDLKKQLQNSEIPNIRTRWLNQESLTMMTLFGKDISNSKDVEVNTIHNPVLFK